MFTFAHVEIPVTDMEKAVTFYAPLFNWKLSKLFGDDYLLISTAEDEYIGGLSKIREMPEISGFHNYVEVEDIEITLAKAERLGGRVMRLKTELPEGFGHYAIVQSPDGYSIGIWTKS